MNTSIRKFSPYNGLMQLAYVTTDFDRTLAEFGASYGVPGWLIMRDLEIETGPGRSARTHTALAWVGPMQLEVFQPLSGDVDVYRWGLPDTGYGIQFHHMAQLFDTEAEFDALEQQVLREEIPVAMRGSSGGGMVRYLYTDHRATLGHYLEHIWYAPAARAVFDQIPQNCNAAARTA
jgi:hypothetical protein